MPRLLGARAGRTDDGHLRQARVKLVQRFPLQTQFAQGRRAKGRQQHIGFDQLAVQGFLAFFGLEVGHCDPHTLVQFVIRGSVVQTHGVTGCAGHGTRRWGRLQLDAGGAHLAAAHQGGRAGQVQAQAEHAYTAQRAQGGGGFNGESHARIKAEGPCARVQRQGG